MNGLDWARLWKFGGVGLVGFVVDGGLLTLLNAQGVGVVLARSLSFSCAVAVTFVLNKAYTFETAAQRRSLALFTRYWVVQILGAATNFLLFLLLVQHVPGWAALPLLPLGIACACSAVLTYTLSRHVFEGGRR